MKIIPLYIGAEAAQWLANCGQSQISKESVGTQEALQDTVAKIISLVQTEGDTGIAQLAERFGDTVLSPVMVRADDIESVKRRLSAETRNTIDVAATRIRRFAEAVMEPMRSIAVSYETFATGLDFRPVSRVACYVPSGRYPLASTALMTAITAKVAGVTEVCIFSPKLTDEILYAGIVSGVTEFYQIGGAQAIAAAVYGTETVKPVAMIVGPGNAYVTEAKRQLQGQVAIDMLAGPSEICIIADGGGNAHWLALDLCSQAEHDPDARAYLLTDDAALAAKVLAELPMVCNQLNLPDFIGESLAQSAILVLPDMEACIAAANTIAPEHLQLHVAKPEEIQPHLLNYGALLIGYNATVSNGDYVAGPNHTLPTDRSARHTGALTPLSFLRAQTWVKVSASASDLHKETEAFAILEGLTAHGAAPRARYLHHQ